MRPKGPNAADLAEVPEISEEELAGMRRVKRPVTMRLDADLYDWLTAKPGPYQQRINSILRAVMQREMSAAK